MDLYRFRPGTSPLIVSMPRAGTNVPEWLAPRLSAAGRALVATHSRYVVDLNRPPDNASLYPGQDTTAIVPLDTFHLEPLYLPGFPPSPDEAAERIETYGWPYHRRLQQAINDTKTQHGHALLWDAHSIFSELPRFFKGRLPDLNLGTADGKSCGAGIGEALLKSVEITRQYGDPESGVHAVQLELSEATYMDERPPYAFRETLARKLRPRLRTCLERFLELAK